jgi:EAL domain-containing protein (putative c-di-GMP-specific phosphodiesterase class I)
LQAKVNSTNEPAIIGAEALIRWHHPIKGLLSPGQFLPQIENSNARVEFAKYVIQQSAQLLNQISQHTEQFQLSFNLSPYDLNDLRVIAELQRVMELYDFDKGSLQIEISESETTVNVDGIRRSIDAIRNLGYSIALDDFGTGMCSLNYFSALAVDAVKIDRAFLESIETSEISRHVVQTIVDLCHGLGREVVVEGVETEKQAQLVTELGCDVLQGYYFGKPEEVKQFLGRLGENVTSIQ